MTLIEECGQHREDDSFFFQPPHFVGELKDKIFEKLYHCCGKRLEINETYTHPYYQSEEF